MYINDTKHDDDLYEMLDQFGDHEPLMGPSDIDVFVHEDGDTYGLETDEGYHETIHQS